VAAKSAATCMSMNTGDQRGFTLAELMVSMVITMLVLGGAVVLTSQVQQSFRKQIEDAAGEQEGRYALDWVSRRIRAAGNNPYGLPLPIPPAPVGSDTSQCPAPGTPYSWLFISPDPDGVNRSVRLQSDSNPPDGLLGGPSATGDCNQRDEDVTISFDPLTNSITFLDNNLGGAATIRTDAVIENLEFIFKDINRQPTANPASVVYVETQVTVRTRMINASTGLPETRLLTQEVRLRGRFY
jgi:prepilin-type N-terminal cleavage/methylation domain-containing protein